MGYTDASRSTCAVEGVLPLEVEDPGHAGEATLAEVSELLEGGWREVERAISAAGATVGDGDINRLAFPY